MCSSETDRLADEITELASHIHAATCRWLGLVAEFDRRQGLGRVGLPLLRALALVALLDLAGGGARARARGAAAAGAAADPRRVRRGPAELFAGACAHARGEGRRARRSCCRLARHATAAQLERLVRAYRGVVARARVAAGGGPERYVTWDHADDGSLLLHARLPAEEGAIVLAALQAGVERLAEGASAEAPRCRGCFRGSARAFRGSAAFPRKRAVEGASAEAPRWRRFRGSAAPG